MSKLIYMAGDDMATRKIVQAYLEKEGLQLTCFDNGNLLFQAFRQTACDLVVLDIAMAGSEGFEISSKLRQLSNLPIIIIAGEESDEDYVFSISIGIDAYLAKPFSPIKLVAHVRALLIRTELSTAVPPPRKQTALTYADTTIYLDSLTVTYNDYEIKLTNTEFNMLKFMFENQHRAISRGELFSKIWGDGSSVGIRATDDTVKRLRKKLGDAGSKVSIDTMWGFGFRLRAKNEG